MAPTSFVVDPSFFADPDGICGLEMAKSAGFSFGSAETELIPLVVSGRPPAPSKAKAQFSHHVTRSISKHHGASSLFFFQSSADLSNKLTAEATLWNPVAEASIEFNLDRIRLLRSSPIGGLLLILRHWNSDTQSFGEPVLRVVACPAMSTLGTFSTNDAPGVNLHEAWDSSSSLLAAMPESDSSCPLLVSAGGFSRKSHPSSVQNFLDSTVPLFIPSGEDLAGSVTDAPGQTHLRAIFLPEHAHLPIGMAWKLKDLTVDTLVESVKALTPKSGASAFSPFIGILEHLAPTLTPWLLAAQTRPDDYSIQAFPYSEVAPHFPDLATGAFPSSISCSTAFAALMDMRYLYGWRLFLDKLFSGIRDEDIQLFQRFLERTATCLHSNTYMGVKLDPTMAPNMMHHFRVQGGWPIPDPLHSDFLRPEIVSFIAQRYEPITIDVHPGRPAPLPDTLLETVAAASQKRHKANTPRTSYVPLDSLAIPFTQAATTKASNAAPATINLVPSPPTTKRVGRPNTPSGESLFQPPDSKMYSPSIPGKPPEHPLAGAGQKVPRVLSLAPSAPQYNEIRDWRMDNAKLRSKCSSEFLMHGILASHGPTEIDINKAAVVTKPLKYSVFARKPQELWCTRILTPLFGNSITGSVDSARTLIQGIIDINGEGFFTLYFSHLFFQAPNLKNLLMISSWNMDEGFDPTQLETSGFTVYHFIKSLRAYAHLPAQLPIDGLPLLQVKHISQFILAWFRSIDTPFGLTESKFDGSILGSRLIYLATLLDKHQVHNLWENGGQKAMTYVWFSSVRQLLHFYQRLVTSSVWKKDNGYLDTDPVSIDPTNRDGQHFLDLIQAYDIQVRDQWRTGRLLTAPSFYDVSSIPSTHFTRPPLPPKVTPPVAPGLASPFIKKEPAEKRARPAAVINDFTAAQPVFELVNPAPSSRSEITKRMSIANPAGSPMPKLLVPGSNGQHGKLSLICLASSVSAPYNVCCTQECHQSQKKRNRNFRGNGAPPPFAHVDLANPIWANQPESFWNPVVAWLRLPSIAAELRPSSFLRAKTPSTPW
jgi:hypothetical protein